MHLIAHLLQNNDPPLQAEKIANCFTSRFLALRLFLVLSLPSILLGHQALDAK